MDEEAGDLDSLQSGTERLGLEHVSGARLAARLGEVLGALRVPGESHDLFPFCGEMAGEQSADVPSGSDDGDHIVQVPMNEKFKPEPDSSRVSGAYP
jgi:hypothetical protein